MPPMHKAQDGGGTGGRPAVTPQPGDADMPLEHFFGPDGRNSAVGEKAVLEEALRFGAGGVLPEDVKKELGRPRI